MELQNAEFLFSDFQNLEIQNSDDSYFKFIYKFQIITSPSAEKTQKTLRRQGLDKSYCTCKYIT